jgi:hypothetical protein
MPSAFVLKLRSHMLCATWATERDGRRAESVVRGVHQLTFRADGEAGPLTFLVSHTSQNVEYEGTVRENGARAVQSNPQCASKHHGRGGHG